jgi:transposase InsO family protein
VVKTMRDERVSTKLCSSLLGLSPSTIRRLVRPAHRQNRQPRPIDPAMRARVCSIVRATHGLVGASNLGRMTGLPRRICAGIKKRELCEMERERKEACGRIIVTAPGVVRGFDAMHVMAGDRKAYWLVAADAAVPYRTSITTVPVYDAKHVIEALEADFEKHGAPLVLRLDRAACQRTPEVTELLTRHQVLTLHGPPRHPLYYGQLERQNREHRAWYARLRNVSLRELGAAGEAMRTALNALWPRSTLDGCTAEQAWGARKPLDVDRGELITNVEQCTSGLVTRGVEPLRARRIAIESALTRLGVLHVKQGGWC